LKAAFIRHRNDISADRVTNIEQTSVRVLAMKIWLYWDRGLNTKTPWPVKPAIDSWRDFNPNWEVELVTSDNEETFISPHLLCLRGQLKKIQHWKDLIMVDLISRHGGLWIDATVFCVRAIEEWLDATRETVFIKQNGVAVSWFLYAS
jgi:mannosyltransferase OCH1-like enzyme